MWEHLCSVTSNRNTPKILRPTRVRFTKKGRDKFNLGLEITHSYTSTNRPRPTCIGSECRIYSGTADIAYYTLCGSTSSRNWVAVLMLSHYGTERTYKIRLRYRFIFFPITRTTTTIYAKSNSHAAVQVGMRLRHEKKKD